MKYDNLDNKAHQLHVRRFHRRKKDVRQHTAMKLSQMAVLKRGSQWMGAGLTALQKASVQFFNKNAQGDDIQACDNKLHSTIGNKMHGKKNEKQLQIYQHLILFHEAFSKKLGKLKLTSVAWFLRIKRDQIKSLSLPLHSFSFTTLISEPASLLFPWYQNQNFPAISCQ